MPFGIFGIPIEPDPEELAREAAQHTDHYNRIMGLINSLSVDDLDTLRMFIIMSATNERFAPHITGIIEGRLYWKDKLCHCTSPQHPQSDHDDPTWLLKQAETKEGSRSHEEMSTRSTADLEFASQVADHAFHSWKAWEEAHPEEHKALQAWLARRDFPTDLEAFSTDDMEEIYQLDHADDGTGRVRCRNCKMEFINLEDRMLKLPHRDDAPTCDGCVHKVKWG